MGAREWAGVLEDGLRMQRKHRLFYILHQRHDLVGMGEFRGATMLLLVVMVTVVKRTRNAGCELGEGEAGRKLE